MNVGFAYILCLNAFHLSAANVQMNIFKLYNQLIIR